MMLPRNQPKPFFIYRVSEGSHVVKWRDRIGPASRQFFIGTSSLQGWLGWIVTIVFNHQFHLSSCFFFYQKWESMIPSPLCPHGFWCSLIFGDGLNYAGCFVKNHEISPWISYSIAIFPSIHVFFSELITVFVGRSPSARYLWTMPGASLLRSGLTGRTWSRVACAKNEGIGCMNQQGLHMNQQ